MTNVSLPSQAWPVSPGQRRLWVLDQILTGESAFAYNMPVALRLDGRLDVEALARAFAQVLARHEALRTTFASVAGEPRQVVSADPHARLEFVDLSAADDADERARELAVRHSAARFDFATGPLLRASVVRLQQDRHLLLFNIHHIVCDEWSLAVLVNDLSAIYGGILDGRPASLPRLSIQYKDYAVWHDQLLHGEAMQNHGQYWREKLAGAVTALALPADRARPRVKSYAAKTVTLALDDCLVGDLKRLAASRRATLFTALVALIKILLFRYTGQTDITVGCPVAGRDHPDLANQIGFYVNTLALCDRLDGGDTVIGILERVRATVSDALEHQAYPFDALVSELKPERDASRSPLFDVSVNLTPASLPSGGLQLPGVIVSGYDLPFATAKVDLSFDFTQTSDGLQLSLIYSSALYDEHRIRRLGQHFEQLIAAAVSDPGRPIGALSLLPDSERAQLLSLAGTDEDFPRDKTIVDLFEQQAEQSADHTALGVGTEVMTYGELNRRANQLARVLQSRGVGPEVPVGVFVDRSATMITALLGILKARAAYLPLDTMLPPTRIAAMLSDSLVPIVITDAASEERLPSFMGSPLLIDAEWPEISLESDENLTTKPYPGSTAYLIYTSGSTGVPKAVAVEHGGLSNLAAVQRRHFGVQRGDRVLQFAASCFDASLFEISMALCSGATLYLGSRDTLLPGPPLVQFLADEQISIATLPPSALAVTPVADLPHLRLISVAGEACTPELPLLWGFGRRFFNLYGPSEATIWSTEALYGAAQGPPSIGRPIPNVKIYILDSRLQLVPVGVPGEICIGGVGVGRGYANRPGLTAERFLPDAFAAGPGARLFRTGDLGRWLEDGALEFLGRADNQVKIRGYRVELGEIEAVLAQHPRVRAAAVVYRADNNGSMHLRGYAVPRGEGIDDGHEVRAWLRASLPDYMVPATITWLREFPSTPAGKIDRHALPDPEAAIVAPDSGFVAPRTPLESVLARIFAEVLGCQRVDVTADFFDIGGHSLLATRVVSRLRESFDIEFPLPRFFQESSVSELAAALKAIDPDRVDKIARALDRLWSMSDEEKQALRARHAAVERKNS